MKQISLFSLSLCLTLMLNAQSYNDVLKSEKYLHLQEEFENDDLNWPKQSGGTSFLQGIVEKGIYKVISESGHTLKTPVNSINISADWEAETSQYLQNGDRAKGFGLAFGETMHHACNVFLINQQGQFIVYQAIDSTLYPVPAWTSIPKEAAYNTANYTQLTVRKTDGNFYFYINRFLVYQCPAWDIALPNFGFNVGAGQQIYNNSIFVYSIERCRSEIEAIVEMDGLFCSQIQACASVPRPTATSGKEFTYLGDAVDELGVSFCNKWGRDAKFSLTITCPDILEPSILTGVLTESNRVYELFPPLRYRLKDLYKFRGANTVGINFNLTINNQVVLNKQVNTNVYGFDHLPLQFQHRRSSAQFLRESLAGAVNEYNPVFRERIIPVLEQDWKQLGDEFIKAAGIWYAMYKNEIRYANNTISGATRRTFFQEYKSHERVWNEKSGNCLDLSLFFAGALKKTGITAYLILKPGHCMVGFMINANSNNDPIYVIEITKLSDTRTFKELKKDPIFAEKYSANKAYFDLQKAALSSDQFDSLCRFFSATTVLTKAEIIADSNLLISIEEMRGAGIQSNNYTAK